MSDSVTLWTVVHQAPLSLGFPRQANWSGLPCPPPGVLPDPGIKPTSMSPALAGRLPALKSLSLGSSSNVLSKTNHATLLSPKFLLPAPPPSSTASGGPGSEAESGEDGSARQRGGREADGSVSLGGRGPLPESTVSTFFILLVERLVRLAAREWKLPTPGVRRPAQDVSIFTFPGRNWNPSPLQAVQCSSLFQRTGHR